MATVLRGKEASATPRPGIRNKYEVERPGYGAHSAPASTQFIASTRRPPLVRGHSDALLKGIFHFPALTPTLKFWISKPSLDLAAVAFVVADERQSDVMPLAEAVENA